MHDLELRQLERAAACGGPDAGSRLLRARHRRGEVDERALALAAWLGDPCALALRPEAAAPQDLSLADYVDELERWGRWLAVRGALELAQWLKPASDPNRIEYRLECSPAVSADVPAPTFRSGRLRPGVPHVVGRRTGSVDLHLNHASVSREHCAFSLTEDGTLWVRDLGSKNGTWIGRRRVGPEQVRLFPGTRITVGDVYLQVVGEDESLLEAVQEWLAEPDDLAAGKVANVLDAARRAEGTEPHQLAAMAAAHAVLGTPALPSYYLARLDPIPAVDVARDILQRALLPVALGAALPSAPAPPRHLRRPVWRKWDVADRPLAEGVHERLGVFPFRRLSRAPERLSLLARTPNGQVERITVFTGPAAAGVHRVFTEADLTPGPHAHATYLGHENLSQELQGTPAIAIRSRHRPGRTLDAWLEDESPTPHQSVSLLRRLCSAAQCAATELPAAGVDFRDVRIDEAGAPFLDHVVERWITEQSDIAEADPEAEDWLDLVSPEETGTSHPIDPQHVAVYRLAGILFMALTGRAMFEGRPTPWKTLRAVRTQLPPRPSSLCRRLSPQLDAVILRALAKDPQERFANPLEFEAALAATPEGAQTADRGSMTNSRAA